MYNVCKHYGIGYVLLKDRANLQSVWTSNLVVQYGSRS